MVGEDALLLFMVLDKEAFSRHIFSTSFIRQLLPDIDVCDAKVRINNIQSNVMAYADDIP